MCGIVGWIDFSNDISNNTETILKMVGTLNRGIKSKGDLYANSNALLWQNHLNMSSKENNSITKTIYGNTYVIVLDGNIYNINEIKKELQNNDYPLNHSSDLEILLTGFIHFGSNILDKINGVFSFAVWNENKKELFLARDHLGVKPLFYTTKNNSFIFSSEIAAILANPTIRTKLSNIGLCEIFGLGPARTSGSGIYDGIKELKPGHFLTFNNSETLIRKYWGLESHEHIDNLETTSKNIRQLIEDSIKSQFSFNTPVCTLLSGGLDSSIITAITSKYYKNNNILHTYSVDYVDNDKNFTKTDFQPDSDSYYINLISKTFRIKPQNIMIDTPELATALEDAMIARNFPGMADVDSSLLLFCKEIAKDKSIALSGECADEIFGGYPWFFKEDALKDNTFPWSKAIFERQSLLNSDISRKIDLKEYIDYRYSETVKQYPKFDDDNKENTLKKKLFYLNQCWFMQTLIERTDRMSMYVGLDVRVPFCDYRLVQYLWNIPWEMKSLNGREKGLLRHIYKDVLPNEIIQRKKSPYPKTHNPTYLKLIKQMLTDIMEDSNSPILELINKEYVWDIVRTNGTSFTKPWFGQLMTGPQLMAYLVQVNMWLKRYNPNIIVY